LSRKYKRRIFANVPTLITPVSPVHNFVRTELLTGVKFGWKKLPSGGQFWVAFNRSIQPAVSAEPFALGCWVGYSFNWWYFWRCDQFFETKTSIKHKGHSP
ncbi:MAG: hypothetical protein ACKVP1_12430, partial [Burkholderiaceae bacterium]